MDKIRICNYFSGNRYDNTTGQFTVPAGGAGLYFLYTNLYSDDENLADFVIRVNGAAVCEGSSDMNQSPGDNGTPSCGAVAVLTEGTTQGKI